jgi:hypothetical protein
VSASDPAIVAALVFARETLSARLERFDVAAPTTFVLVGALLTNGPLAPEDTYSARAYAHSPCLVASHAGVAAHHRCCRVIRGG